MRIKKTVKFILIVGSVLLVSSEEQQPTTNASVTRLNSTNLTQNAILKKADTTDSSNDQSFMSRVASWIFPFGKSDAEPAETNNYNSQYFNQNNNYQANQGFYQPKDSCNPCNKEPWVPIVRNYGKNPMMGYLPPNSLPHQENVYNQPIDQFRPPLPSGGYGVPQTHTNPPIQSYGAPPAQSYGSPASPPIQSYGAPPNPPVQTYGPPQNNPIQSYGPPQPISPYNPPQNTFGPPQHNYGPPQATYAASQPVIDYVPNQAQSYSNFYNLPSKSHQKPFKSSNRPSFGSQKAQKSSRQNNYRPQSTNSFGQPYQYIPVKLKSNEGYALSRKIKPPPLDQHQSPANYQLPLQANHFPNNKPHVTNPEYLPPPQQLPISYEPSQVLPPIPLPNLSLAPVAPLHNAQPFHGNYAQSGSTKIETHSNPHYNNNYNDNVQVIKSIPIADYVAAIEHPINVIRSPIFEVNVANATTYSDINQEGKAINSDNIYNLANVGGTGKGNENTQNLNSYNGYHNQNGYTPNQQLGRNDYNKLSENPIIVDDAHAAASSFNDSFQDDRSNRSTGASVANYNNLESQEEELISEIVRGLDFNRSPKPLPLPTSDAQFTYTTSKPLFNDISHSSFENSKWISQHSTTIVHPGPTGNLNNFDAYRGENAEFIQPTLDYTNWSPQHDISTSMQPPPKGQSFWLTNIDNQFIEPTTKKPKQIQIIIPYTINSKENFYEHNQGRKVPSKINNFQAHLPLYTIPPTSESVWTEHTKNDIYNEEELHEVTNKPTTQVINIKDLFKYVNNKDVNYQNLPFDIIRLQKNIDGWTEQEYADKMELNMQKTTTTKLAPSKNIPGEYLTTLPFSKNKNDVTTNKPHTRGFYDHEPAGSSSSELKFNEDVETNLVTGENYLTTTTRNYDNHKKLDSTSKPNWDQIPISVSPLTKEKVYVVTPLPKPESTQNWRSAKESNLGNNSSTFSISIEPMKNKTRPSDVRVILSEWPHLINNLATTTPTTQRPKTSRHPLFGLMDLSSYTPPVNSTIQTYSGHSKVINVVTSAVSSKKKSDGNAEKKAVGITTVRIPT